MESKEEKEDLNEMIALKEGLKNIEDEDDFVVEEMDDMSSDFLFEEEEQKLISDEPKKKRKRLSKRNQGLEESVDSDSDLDIFDFWDKDKSKYCCEPKRDTLYKINWSLSRLNPKWNRLNQTWILWQFLIDTSYKPIELLTLVVPTQRSALLPSKYSSNASEKLDLSLHYPEMIFEIDSKTINIFSYWLLHIPFDKIKREKPPSL